jgi:hypothetical protein
MITSAIQDSQSEVTRDERLSVGQLAYFEAKLSGLVHQATLRVLKALERNKGFTKRAFAYRIRRKPEQITRWLSYPSNLTLGTMSAIFLGGGYVVERITLLNLATGERICVPVQPQYIPHVSATSQREAPIASASPYFYRPGQAESVQQSGQQSQNRSLASALAA